MWGQNGRGPQQGQQQQNPWMAGLAQRIAAARQGGGWGQGPQGPQQGVPGAMPGAAPGGGWGGPGQGLVAGLQGLQGRLPQGLQDRIPQWGAGGAGAPGGAPPLPQGVPGNTGVVGPNMPIPQMGMQGGMPGRPGGAPPQGAFSPGWSRGLRGPGAEQGAPPAQRMAAPVAPMQPAPQDDDEEEM